MQADQIVAIGGLPGSGKTSAIKPYLNAGFTRVNRDTTGGKLDKADSAFFLKVREHYAKGVRRFVFDNTYCFAAQRAMLVQVADELGLPVHLKMLDVDVPKAQLFAARRQIQRYGKLFQKADYALHKGDPNMFPPAAQFAFAKALAKVVPSTDEGFASVEILPVPVVWGPEYVNRAIILDLDGTVRVTPDEKVCPYPRNKGEVIIMEGRRDVLKRKQAEGFILCGATNQSGVSYPPISKKTGLPDPKYLTEAQVQECIKATCEGLGVDIDVLYATDRGGPPATYWRKPCPGMGVHFIEKYKLDPSQCVMVGDMKSDKTFAERCGFQFVWAHQFFQ